jgi:hypothetical protein
VLRGTVVALFRDSLKFKKLEGDVKDQDVQKRPMGLSGKVSAYSREVSWKFT